ncbi:MULTISPECIES: phytanoyl-CoA dioxygenase family protein [Streptomyces]
MDDTEHSVGTRGYRPVAAWTTSRAAAARAAQVRAQYGAHRTEVVKNPHLGEEWVQAAVSSPAVLKAVHAQIGPAVAVENTFLVIKWPDAPFDVPWHQDGINDRIQLVPERSLAVWLAVTDTDAASGCLRVIPGSHTSGYLPYGAEPVQGSARGRALTVAGMGESPYRHLPARAGDGYLMDVRTVHSSGSNHGRGVRIGLNIRFVAPDGWVIRDGSSPGLYPISGTGW